MHEALDDPRVREVVAQKSAQIAWTDGVLLNYIGRRIDADPCPMIVMFAKDSAAKEFAEEKLVPMIEASPRLAALIPVHKKHNNANRAQYKSYPGGFLKLVTSRSPSSVKSTPVPVVAVEEPDDADENVRDQGDSVSLLIERVKTFARSKVIYGGTPTVKGFSRVEAAYDRSDRRKFWIPCHHCDESHVLTWDNVQWMKDADIEHQVFGRSRMETAVYVCPHCGGTWNDAERNRNVKKGVWVADAPFRGTAGFYINELYSPFPGSKFAALVEKFLIADHALRMGDDSKMRAFVNSTKGLAYEYQTALPDAGRLAERAEEYEEGTVPAGGLILTCGVDVQHDRLSVLIRAWGRGEESWLVSWQELYGSTLLANAGPWLDLEKVLFDTRYQHASGVGLQIRATSLDSSDGQTADATYSFCRKHRGQGVMPVKGAQAGSSGAREIFSPPRVAVDTDYKQKASKYGLRPFIVGVDRAKDLILGADANAGRIKLTGSGPGRMHVPKGVRPDYFKQVLAEIKAPSKISRKRVWTRKSGERNEALDCEVYALHAARAVKVHLMREEHWQALEGRIEPSDQPPPPVVEPPKVVPMRRMQVFSKGIQ